MYIKLPENVSYIISKLEDAGFEAYAVGGCVRDSILGREPDDWDITTSAAPLQVKKLFNRTIDTGIQHGTVTVMLNRVGFEVTTYRVDGEYEDGRHPKDVKFTSSLIEDLKRRDFTINAMAYNDKNGLVDEFGGRADLDGGIIRCVGKAEERFAEDALRIMRAVRFSAQLGFTIEDRTAGAIVELADRLKNISAERIQTELVKLVTSPNPDYIKIAYDLGVTRIILPELDDAFETLQNNPHHMYTVGEHIVRCMSNVRNDKALRIAALLHDIGKPLTRTTDKKGIDHFHGHVELSEEMALKILRRLKFDNDTISKVSRYIRYHDCDIEPTHKAVRRAVSKIGEEYFGQVLEIKQADILAQSYYRREEKLALLSKVVSIYNEIKEENQCVSLKTLAVDGSDLIGLGIPAGRKIGEILNALLEDVLQNPEHNTREHLLSEVEKFK